MFTRLVSTISTAKFRFRRTQVSNNAAMAAIAIDLALHIPMGCPGHWLAAYRVTVEASGHHVASLTIARRWLGQRARCEPGRGLAEESWRFCLAAHQEPGDPTTRWHPSTGPRTTSGNQANPLPFGAEPQTGLTPAQFLGTASSGSTGRSAVLGFGQPENRQK